MRICVTHAHSQVELSNKYQRVRLEELEGVEDSSCLEVHLVDTADYIRSEQREELYRVAASKLRHGGKLIVSGNDLVQICIGVAEGTSNVYEANEALFKMRSSMDTMTNVRETLKKLGLKIKTAYYDMGDTYVVEGIRE